MSGLSLWRNASRQIVTQQNKKSLQCFLRQNGIRNQQVVCLSSNSGDGSKNEDEEMLFHPRRRSTYRQDQTKTRFFPTKSSAKEKVVNKNSLTDLNAGSDWQQDPEEWIDFYKGLNELDHRAESHMRMADFFTAARGSTEDLVGRRRALMDEEDPDAITKELDRLSKQELYYEDFKLGEDDASPDNDEDDDDEMDDGTDPNQLAYGPWSETVVRVDRVQKVQRGGTMLRYRSLVVGGNANGVAGFGVAKSNSPQEATEAAARMCKRNIFFLDRYKGQGLTTDLVGKHNSCQVVLRSVSRNYGLHGHPLIQEICKYFGLTDVSSKTHGNRNVYNVVRATFKAIITHESLEEIALKRGKRLMLLDRSAKMQI